MQQFLSVKIAAKLVIEDHFDRKFLTLVAERSKLEQYLWGTQVREANNLEGETPILSNNIAAKGISVAEVAEVFSLDILNLIKRLQHFIKRC